MEELALSLSGMYKKDTTILGMPISRLAKKSGLNVNQVYAKLIPRLAQPNLGEAIRYAEVAIHYATVVDRNRLREECGESFIIALDQIITLIKDGLASKEDWIIRKAIALHAQLIDESAEKQRFVEAIMTEKRVELLARSQQNIKKLEEEIVEFEANKDGVFAVTKQDSSLVEMFNG
jgi:2-phospho-L-lactate transferase/gluconeogenesis factor (CofD/UPF0052 family)